MRKIKVRFGGKDSKRIWTLEEAPTLLAVRTRLRKPMARVHFHTPSNGKLLRRPRVLAIPYAGVEVYETASQKTRNEFRKSLPPEPEVQFAGRVLRTADSGIPVLYTENLFVKFDAGSLDSVCKTILEKYGLEIAKKLDFAESAYFVKSAEGTGLRVFEIAEQLLAEKKVELCHPELVTEKSFRVVHSNQWHLKRCVINGHTIDQHASVEAAWEKSRGAGIRIAVIDDGMDMDHQEFDQPGKIVAPYDATLDSDDPSPGDRDHHGTACAGVACASGIGSPGACGVAPEAALIPIRHVSALGSIQEAQAFYHAANNGADVISCSWGPVDGDWWDPTDPRHKAVTPLPDSTRLAIDYCIQKGRQGKGCVITWAAGNGNESADNDGYAKYDKVIAVAACNDIGQKSNYSDSGDCVWCAFPSSQLGSGLTTGIWTTDRTGKVGYNRGQAALGDPAGNYTNDFGGTSSACPGVAGVAALILSANPDLRWDQVKQILAETADKIDPANGDYDQGRSPYFGFGRVNARKAVEEAIKSGGSPRDAKAPAAFERPSYSPKPSAIRSGTPEQLALDYLKLQAQLARNFSRLMDAISTGAGKEKLNFETSPAALSLTTTERGPDLEDAVIRALNDTTDVPFGPNSSLSADLGVNTNGRWEALANTIRDYLPQFGLSGRALRQKMGPPRGDTVSRLIGIVSSEVGQ